MGGCIGQAFNIKRADCSFFLQEKVTKQKNARNSEGFFITRPIRLYCGVGFDFFEFIQYKPSVIFRYLYLSSKYITTSLII